MELLTRKGGIMPQEKQIRSRRTFLGLAGVGMAWASVASASRSLRNWTHHAWATPADFSLQAMTTANLPVHIDSNENPYGPSEKAIAAMKSSFSLVGRYVHNPGELHRALCEHNKVDS